MNKKEYVRMITALGKARQEALEFNRKEVERVSQQYIADNCKLSVGDNVMLGKKEGVIEKIEVSNEGHFFGQWKKFRKDGNLFRISHTFYYRDYKQMVKVESKE